MMAARGGAHVPNVTEPLRKYKIVVVGSGGVGKSALTIQYVQKTFVEDHDPTIEDSFMKNEEIDDEWCSMDVLDTAGQEEYNAMREQYMRKGEGFVVVFSVVDRVSFDLVRRFHDDILRVKDISSYPMILVANKVDLVHQRRITEEEGKRMAADLNMAYIETSAKPPPHNVDTVFHELVRSIRRREQSEAQASPKSPLKKSSRRRHRCAVL